MKAFGLLLTIAGLLVALAVSLDPSPPIDEVASRVPVYVASEPPPPRGLVFSGTSALTTLATTSATSGTLTYTTTTTPLIFATTPQ